MKRQQCKHVAYYFVPNARWPVIFIYLVVTERKLTSVMLAGQIDLRTRDELPGSTFDDREPDRTVAVMPRTSAGVKGRNWKPTSSCALDLYLLSSISPR